ncbi:MAG: hypothetical protein KBF73_08920 [Flavobacteriales bacterium]|nr:hypothetical protein [Flavobacteriales bacterium]
MSIKPNIKSSLEAELKEAKSIWLASAMITTDGWNFIKSSIPKGTVEHYLIGIDLSTSPSVFESILANKTINARVYQTKYTFHPKVYLIEKKDGLLTAFVGSSNTTTWGLEKNVEMNFHVNDPKECKQLLGWFQNLYVNGFLITDEFLKDYKRKYSKASARQRKIDMQASSVKLNLTKAAGQFFNVNQHEVFRAEYHRANSEDLKRIRKEVRDKYVELHKTIYPRFKDFGLNDLHCHHSKREIVSRHYFNQFSGNYVNSIWLHYGKSEAQLEQYHIPKDKSINKPDSFINNIRIQVITRAEEVGIWLVLGRHNGSRHDRKHFKQQMQDKEVREKFFALFKGLDEQYWISSNAIIKKSDIKKPEDLIGLAEAGLEEDYFIIGCTIPMLDKRVSAENISDTVLEEFQKLYPLYEIMRHK